MSDHVTVIVPTRNEVANVHQLLSELAAALTDRPWDVIFVDDSDDDTPAALEALSREDPRVRMIHRKAGHRSGGLGSAVMTGFLAAAGDLLVVMDADLQHPPTVVPRLIDALRDDSADIAVASRYTEGGSAEGLDGMFRLAASRGCRKLVHLVLPRTRGTSDPLGGFFALKASVLTGTTLRPDGYKILLDILVRCRWQHVAEVPYQFAPRFAGASKSDMSEGRRFLRHVRTLRAVRLIGSNAMPIPRQRTSSSTAQPMHVLILTSEAPPVISGISSTVAALSTGLTERGHTVDVVSRADFPRLIRQEIRLSAFALFWPRFRRQMRRYDVVNVHGPVPTISEVFLLLARTLHLAHRPAIVYTHHSDLAIPRLERWCAVYNRLTGHVAHTADVVVVSSLAYQEKLRRLHGAPVEVVPWGIDARGKVVERAGTDPARLRVLFVGQLRPYKGVPVLIDAVSGLAIDVTIIGSGPQRAELEAQVDALDAHNVTFLGRVSDEELWQAYSQNDVVVLPSTTTAEAYGLVLAEGMTAGCIPVASDLPGVREVVGEAGLVAIPGSVDSLRAVLTSILEDLPLRARLAAAAAGHAHELSIEATARRYEQVFEHAVAEVTGRQAALAVPARWADPEAFLAELADGLGLRRVSLSLLAGGRDLRPARVWSHGNSSFKVEQAPVAQYVAQRNQPLFINPTQSRDAELDSLLTRPELTSSLLLPVRWNRDTVSVINLSTGPEDERHLGQDDLDTAMRLIYASISISQPDLSEDVAPAA